MLHGGKHVLCEKPITCTLSEYEELRALAKEKNLIYMEAMMSAHLPQLSVL
jgi:predicted dehydrogenase